MKLEVRQAGTAPLAGSGFCLKAISLDLESGSNLSVIGPNGSGKSTLLRRLACLIAGPGEIRLDGCTLDQLSVRERARRICLLAQREHHLPGLLVRDYVSLARLPWRGLLERGSHRDQQRVAASLERCGVSQLSHRLLHELSGGEIQLVRIAAALCQEVKVLLLDEPATFLDPGHTRQLRELLADLEQGGMILVQVSHDLNEVIARGGRVLALRDGERLAECAAGDLAAADWLDELYHTSFCRITNDQGSWLLNGARA